MKAKEQLTEGWGNPQPFNFSTKFHYFVDGQSLCGRWGFYRGDLEIGLDDHNENCSVCRKKKAKRDKAKSA